MPTTTRPPTSWRARLRRRPPDVVLTIVADASRFVAAANRAAAELARFGVLAREVAGGILLSQRRLVDADASPLDAADWMSPACRGWLCGACPGLDCHHRCHPGGHLR